MTTGSIISKKAKVSKRTDIGNNVVVMDGAFVSEGVKICNNVVIYPDTYIGKNSLILDNCVLGRNTFNVANLDVKPPASLKGLRIGDGCQIGANTVLYRGSVIGKNAMICDFCSIREKCDIGDNAVLGRNVLLNYDVKIGKNTRIMDGAHFGGNMVIEDNVFIGPFVCSANDKYLGIKKIQKRGAYIKEGAKIGIASILLANITIGENAIIGAGTLVNKDIGPNCLAYGFPVKIVKKLTSSKC